MTTVDEERWALCRLTLCCGRCPASWDNFAQGRQDDLVRFFEKRFEAADVGDYLQQLAACAVGDHDLGMRRGPMRFAAIVKLLVEFFAGPQADNFDFDVVA